MFCSENWFHLEVKTFQAPPPPKKKKKKQDLVTSLCFSKFPTRTPVFLYTCRSTSGAGGLLQPPPPLFYARQEKVINRKLRKIGRHSIEILLNFICLMLLISHCQCLVSKRF